jgi:hypothetical protein
MAERNLVEAFVCAKWAKDERKTNREALSEQLWKRQKSTNTTNATLQTVIIVIEVHLIRREVIGEIEWATSSDTTPSMVARHAVSGARTPLAVRPDISRR